MVTDDKIIEDLKVTQKNDDKKKKISPEKQQKIIKEISDAIQRWYAYFSHNITQFREDRYFYNGRQWDIFAEMQYTNLGKLPYMFNHIKPIGKQIIGEQVNMRPSLDLTPVNIETSDIASDRLVEGLLKKLAYSNEGQTQLSVALEHMLSGGWGVIHLYKDYESEYSFDQKPGYYALDDPTNTFFDPNARKISKTDGEYFGFWEVMDEDDFKTMHPKVKYTTGTSILGEGQQFDDYIDSKSVVIVQFSKRIHKQKTLVQLTNHIDFKIEVLEEDIEKTKRDYKASGAMRYGSEYNIPPLEESNRRKTDIAFIKTYKATNMEVFDSEEWPSKSLPGIFVPANRYFREGKEIVESFIHEAKDAQKTYNYCLSEAINAIARTRRESVWMTDVQSAGYEDVLRYPDRQQTHVPFNPDPRVPGGGPLFRPPEEISEAFFKLAEVAKNDIMKTLGVSGLNNGEIPNTSSGVAIGRTIIQGNLALVPILKNLQNAQQELGQIILELIPKLYDTERVVGILDANGSTANATVNQVQPGGQIKNNLLDVTYHLEVNTVANFAIQQEMINEMLFKLAGLDPQRIVPLVSDIIASHLDASVKSQLVQRLESLVPPAVLAKEHGDPPPPPAQPDPMQVLEMQKLSAEIKKLLADAMASMHKSKLENNAHGTSSAIEIAKIESDNQANQTDLLKTVLKSQAEIEKQKLNNLHDAWMGMNILKHRPSEKEGGYVH